MVINSFPNKSWILLVCSTIPLKTLWEKEKLLVTSNFSFSYYVFYQFPELSAISLNLKLSCANTFSLDESNICRFGKGLILIQANLPFPKHALVFMCLQHRFLENTVRKGEIACHKQFLHFPQCSTCLET